ncbi:MAG: tetratricopeptide repeat protein [Candidatus Aminicenantes bacterium]|nr:tetratricopeptide repeat protein [Candidatus Aminicenantes bacterium]
MSPKTFKASTAKQVLSQISHELGPDAIIVSHGKTQDSEGRLRVEAIASPRAEVATPEKIPLTTEAIATKFRLKKLFLFISVVIAFIIAGVLIWQLLLRNTPANPFSQTLSVAVISFENQTGDDFYDYLNKVIPNLLITNLEQSGYFRVASWERLHDLLKQIGKEDVDVIDKDLGFKLCQMDDIEALIIGSFTRAGEMFATDLKVLDVETKRILKSVNSRGKGEESIIQSQIDELCREISQGIGISENRLERAPFRIADVTTNSLDAYYNFLRGYECYVNINFEDSRTYLEKAIELDPSFSMAYLYLGYSLWALGENKAKDEALSKAKNFSARATEKERLFIDGWMALYENDLDESFRIFKKMAERYPKEKKAHQSLAEIYFAKELFDLAFEEYDKALELDPSDKRTLQNIIIAYSESGNYEKAIEYINKYISVSSNDYFALNLTGSVYFKMGKLDEALAIYNEASEAYPDFGPDWKISYIHALKEDYPEATRCIDRSINEASPFDKSWLYFIESFYQYWIGSLERSKSNLIRQIDEADARAQVSSISPLHTRANVSWMMGWISYDRGEYELCRKHFKTWFDIYMEDVLQNLHPNDVAARKTLQTALYYFYLGLIDLKLGEIESAKSRLVEINSLMPDILSRFKTWISFYHDILKTEILLAEGDVKKAITTGEKSSPLGSAPELGFLVLYNVPFLKDVLARAYRKNGEIDQAIAEYKRLITFDPRREERYLIHPKHYYRLAELYEKKDMKREAIGNYEKFLKLWHDADPDLPEVIEAKKRLSELQNEPMTMEQR